MGRPGRCLYCERPSGDREEYNIRERTKSSNAKRSCKVRVTETGSLDGEDKGRLRPRHGLLCHAN